MNCADPIRVAQILMLSARDRDQRELPKHRIKRGEIRQVQSAMLGGQSTLRDVANQWGVKDIDMKMQDVEFIDPAANLLKHDHVVGQGVPDGRVERSAMSQQGTNFADVLESPLANSVTSCP